MGLDSELPRVLVGPLLRHVAQERLMLWLVTTQPTQWRFRLNSAGNTPVSVSNAPQESDAATPQDTHFSGKTAPSEKTRYSQERVLSTAEHTELPLGKHAFLQLLEIQPDEPLPLDCTLYYDLAFCHSEDSWQWIADWAPHLCHEGHGSPHLVCHSRIQRIMHGSCRKPHHASPDALCRVDEELRTCSTVSEDRPSLLLMTGDQVYIDDVAGPMLRAIHQLSERLELFDEVIDDALVSSGAELVQHEHSYYKRSRLLPRTEENAGVIDRFFAGARKPIFTTASAENHLVTLSEVLAMYMLVWSPTPWTLIQTDQASMAKPMHKRYQKERKHIEQFVTGLPAAARALSHVSSYMMFDDHDITDDWNLSLLWERSAYGHAFSRRIVGNALIAYTLCQGWGNGEGLLKEIMPDCEALLANASCENQGLPSKQQDALINTLLGFRQWQYTLNTQPAIVVLDTRTHRWHRRDKPSKPSGLMDFEALTDFQQRIMGLSEVIVVSPAPVFGVKLIEIIQRIFTFFGQPLLVDAENWMAHHEAATVILSIFEHSQTPETFVLLSGDVHYSFAYDVRLRYQSDSPAIWQITSSGIKNEFPVVLIEWLDRLNRWLFAPWSPLNLLTQRAAFRIWPRLPTGRSAGERLWNHSGIGDVRLDNQGRPAQIMQLNSDNGGTQFKQGNREA